MASGRRWWEADLSPSCFPFLISVTRISKIWTATLLSTGTPVFTAHGMSTHYILVLVCWSEKHAKLGDDLCIINVTRYRKGVFVTLAL